MSPSHGEKPPRRGQQTRRFAAGEFIFKEGDASEVAYVLRSGQVEILKTRPGGTVRLAILGPGDVLGEMGLLEERPRSATARALDAVVADAIAPSEFVHRLLHEPESTLGLLRALFERLRASNRWMTDHAEVVLPGHAPTVTLVPLTPETRAALPAEGLVVPRLPFLVGRRPDGREENALLHNDVAFADTPPYVLSPHHFALDARGEAIVVRDRGSRFGTVVNGTPIGALTPRDSVPLEPGDNTVVAGGPRPFKGQESPFRFRVVVDAR